LQNYITPLSFAMKQARFLVFILLACFLTGCGFKLKPYIGEDAKEIVIKRYDRLERRYLTTGDFAALQEMNTDYPIETRTLLEKVLQLGVVEDPELPQKFLSFFQDSTLQTLITDTEAEFMDIDDLNKGLNDAFDKVNDWLPNLPRPEVYTQICALQQSIVIGEDMIAISLDKYLGERYPLYQKYYTYEQRKQMNRSYIVPDCMMWYLLSLYPLAHFESRSQIERDVHFAKFQWAANQITGKTYYESEYITLFDKYVKQHPELSMADLLGMTDYAAFME